MGPPVDIIDCTITQPPPRRDDWIGRGVKWPTTTQDVPDALNQLYQQNFTVPAAYTTNALYDPAKTVSVFLREQQLRTQSKALTYHLATSYFSSLSPNTTLHTNNTAPIPPFPLLHDLKKVSGQALLNGAKSIEYPSSSGKHYDLWILQYWLNVHEILELQSTWAHAREWLNGSCTRDPVAASVFTAALEELHQLECNAIITALGARSIRTSILARLVSNAWLSDDIIDMMVEHEMNRVQLEPKVAGHVIIAHLAVVNTILKAQEPASWDTRSQTHVANLEKAIESKSVHEIYFPVFWADWEHWIAISVNFIRKEVSYGDSLARKLPKPQRILDRILWWLSKCFSGKFRVIGRKLESGEQFDSYSCGICAMNAISHSIFGDVLWTDSRKALYRARWFRDICQVHWKTKTLTDAHPTTRKHVQAQDRSSGLCLLNTAEGSESQRPQVPLSHTAARNTHSMLEDSPTPSPRATDAPSPSSPPGSSISMTPLRSSPPPPPISSPVPIYRSSSPPRSSTPPLPTSCGPIFDVPRMDIDTVVDSESGVRLEVSARSAAKAESKTSHKPKDLRSFFTRGAVDGETRDEPTNTTTKKRKRLADAGDERPRKRDTPGVIGTSRSNRHSSAANKAAKEGTFVPKPSRLTSWKSKVRELHDDMAFERGIRVLHDDEPVEFPDPQQGKVVRHVRCGKTIAMKVPCNTSHWITHIKKCLVKDSSKVTKGKGAGMLTLSGLASSRQFPVPPIPTPASTKSGARSPSISASTKSTARSTSMPTAPILSCPCPGLDMEHYPDVALYLSRPGALGGGARSVSVISHERFGAAFSTLSTRAKREVGTVQRHEWVWRNEHDTGKVFATACQKSVSVRADIEKPPPCTECHALLSNHAFRHLLKIPIPLDANMKFVNKGYQHKELMKIYSKIKGLREILEHPDPKRSPFIQFTLGALDGSFKDDIFTGLVEAVMVRKDKLERGVGMQNFKYAPAYDEFLHIINAHSPRAYTFFRQHLPGRTQRSIQYNEALQPRFPIGICEETFSIIAGHLDNLEYTGPVGLSCDDTKLLPGFDPVYDKSRDGFLLLGGIGEPLQVANPEEVTRAIQDGQLSKAEKIRLWVIQVPLPGVQPIILAALGVGNKTTASLLWEYHERILAGLCKYNINVVSSAHDGATTERNVQQKLRDTATDFLRYSIKHPARDASICLDIPCFGPSKHPIIPLQDANHGQKTYRNNLFSGCTMLTLGDEVAMYKHVRDMAFSEDGPLYRRDVEKVDRQDDNAATRLFSADALQWLATHDEARHRGTSIYLFVYGELGSVYSSREADIFERMKMALRAEFFTDLWELWLIRNGYSKARHFLSHQAAAITHTLSRGFLQLVFLFRDHLNARYPLVPWLLSTEPNEHLFSMCRTIVKDFKMLDFFYMIPKLLTQLRSSTFGQYHGNEKARASGYNHTYMDNRSVDLALLRRFPSDSAIDSIAQVAFDETLGLFALLGVSPDDLLGSSPSHDLALTDSDHCFEDEDENRGGDEWEVDADDIVEDLLDDALAVVEDLSLDVRTEDEVMKITYAAISLSVDTHIRINQLPEHDDEASDELMFEAANMIAKHLERSRAAHAQDTAPNVPGASPDDSQTIDLSELVRLRRAHQTRQAARGVRTRGKAEEPETSDGEDSESDVMRTRQKFLAKLRDILRSKIGEADIRAAGTGLERAARWMSGGNEDDGNGNVVNAAQAAKIRASKALALRRKVYQEKVRTLDVLQEERVSPISPLKSDETSFAYVLVSEEICLGRVLSVYSKGGGKNGKHAWVSGVDSICAASYIPTQVYSHTFGRSFTAAKRDAIARGRRKTYALIDSNVFLCLTHTPPKVVNGNLELTSQDIQLYRSLVEVLPSVQEAVKKLRARKRGKGAAAVDEEVSDHE